MEICWSNNSSKIISYRASVHLGGDSITVLQSVLFSTSNCLLIGNLLLIFHLHIIHVL